MTIEQAQAIISEPCPFDLMELLMQPNRPDIVEYTDKYDQAQEYLNTHKVNLAGNLVTKTICKRCSGSGYLPQYDHIDNGQCWSCGGTGYTEIINL